MSYLDRLREEITLTSPGGAEFTANWSGNPVTLTNNVGIHKFPGIQGARVQDLRPDAFLYPLTLFFTGDDNDIDSTEFMETLRDEAGTWRIDHPVKGPLFLTFLSATENVQPITSGGVTTVETNWIEGLPESAEIAAAQLQAQAEAQAAQANATGADQFDDTALQDTAAERQSIISTVGKAITEIKKTLKFVENAAILSPEVDAIASAIENTLSKPLIDTTALAGQLQRYVQIFTLGQNSAVNAVKMFQTFTNSILGISPDQPNASGISEIAVTELVASAALVASGQSGLIGGITSRQETVTIAQTLNDIFNGITDSLDLTQSLYADEFIDKQYFSQSGSYGDSLIMTSLSVGFLLSSLFGLPAERIIILKEDKSIMQIAHDEYGSISDSESDTGNIDLLITSNGFTGDDMWLLDAGREVLIYQ